jgi:hypothetical protein
MNPPPTLATSPSELESLARRWREQEQDLRAAAASLSTEGGGLPAGLRAGVRRFLDEWGAEIEVRAGEASEIAQRLAAVTRTSLDVDQHWGASEVWDRPA